MSTSYAASAAAWPIATLPPMIDNVLFSTTVPVVDDDKPIPTEFWPLTVIPLPIASDLNPDAMLLAPTAIPPFDTVRFSPNAIPPEDAVLLWPNAIGSSDPEVPSTVFP